MNYQKVMHINCSLCDSNNFEEIARKVQFNMPYTTVICDVRLFSWTHLS